MKVNAIFGIVKQTNNKKTNDMNSVLTTKEITLLASIRDEQNELGHSDYISNLAETKKNAGIISSLEKKGMIYNSYADWSKQDFLDMCDSKPFKMWCLTHEAVEFVGVPNGWKTSNCWESHIKHGGTDFEKIYLNK